jgi:hypothetical protein
MFEKVLYLWQPQLERMPLVMEQDKIPPPGNQRRCGHHRVAPLSRLLPQALEPGSWSSIGRGRSGLTGNGMQIHGGPLTVKQVVPHSDRFRQIQVVYGRIKECQAEESQIFFLTVCPRHSSNDP